MPIEVLLTFLVILAAGLTAGQVSRGDDGPFPRPAPDAIAKAAEKAREVYKADLAKAHKPKGKALLAAEMLTAADGVGKDDASRFVLLTMAKAMAVDADDRRLAIKAVTALARRFEPDGPSDPEKQIESATHLGQRRRAPPRTNAWVLSFRRRNGISGLSGGHRGR